MWKLFLDDERDLNYIGESGLEWRIARKNSQAQKLVEELGMPIEMSLDHDLGIVYDEEKGSIRDSTTMEFLKWLQEWWETNGRPRVPDFQAHSVDPVGVQNIRSFMRSWLRIADLDGDASDT